MRRMLVSRISRRVLAEHHIALSKDFASRKQGLDYQRDHVGVIHTSLDVKESIDRCVEHLRSRPYDADHDLPKSANVTANWSEVVVDGHIDTRFAYIQEHLESA